MKRFKFLFIALGIIFVLTALTFYLNRVVFPVQLKKIVIAQAETFLKRKVEIETLHFNWVKGFIVDKIKIYQKDSSDAFIQVERLSFGVIFIPGFKQHKITIPFINIEQPSAQLIRTGDNQWNFSDLLIAPATSKDDKPSPFAFNLAGINIINGKIRLDDVASAQPWSELFDTINLKIGLSLKGIAFDLNTSIPQKKGMLAAVGSYQPLNQTLDANVQLKNIRPHEYLIFAPPIEGLKFTNGVIQDLDVDVSYNPNLINAKGDINLKNLDIAFNDQSIKGNIDAKIAEFKLNDSGIDLQGQIHLNNGHIQANGIAFQGDIDSDIRSSHMDKDALNIDGDLTAKNTNIKLAADQIIKGTIALEKIKVRHSKEGSQILGNITAKNLDVLWGQQTFKTNAVLKPITIQMKNENDIAISGDVQLSNATAMLSADQSFKGNATLQELNITLKNKKDLTFKGKVSLDELQLQPTANINATGSIDLPSLAINFIDDIFAIETRGEFNNWQVNLDKDKSIVVESTFSLNAQYPLKDPTQLQYNGTLNVLNAQVKGYPFGPFNEISLNSEFKTDQLNVKLLSLIVMETSIKAAGTAMNFKAPVLDFEASSNKIDLSKIKNILPAIFTEYGLETTGNATFNLQFQGLALDPLSGKIQAKASLDDVNIASNKFNQRVDHISGNIEGTPNSVAWNNFTGTYLNKTYTLTGNLNDFKNPKVKTSLKGEDVGLNADISKDGDVLSIKTLKGKYLNITFDATGDVTLATGQQPLLDINGKLSANIEDLLPLIPAEQLKVIEPLNLNGQINLDASIKGVAQDWQNWTANATLTSPSIGIMGYTINDINLSVTEHDQRISSLTLDAIAYDGKIHAVGSSDLSTKTMPFDLALNIDALNMSKLKMDIPNLKTEEINGKFYLTTVAKGNTSEFTNLQAKGSLAIREGFLGEFKVFKGLLGILNTGLKLGQVMITDVEGNFVIEEQRLTTENLRLISPTIVLLTEGWVNFDQTCDLNVVVDMTSGIVPSIAEEVLRTLKVHIFDKISNPKFEHKISVPQVINSIIKTIGIFQ